MLPMSNKKPINKKCKVNASGIERCTKKHNRLLHSGNKMAKRNQSINVSAATIDKCKALS